MSATSVKTAPELLRALDIDQLLANRLRQDQLESRDRKIARIGRLWDQRKLLGKFLGWGIAASLLIAFLIPVQYASTTRLMPPDPPGGQGMAMLAGIAGKMGASLGALGGNLLGMNTSADLFAGVLESRTVQNDLIAKYDLRQVYGERRWVDTRKELARRTDISIDRKSGILTIQVVDHDPKRANALAQEYVAQLNEVVTQLNPPPRTANGCSSRNASARRTRNWNTRIGTSAASPARTRPSILKCKEKRWWKLRQWSKGN